MDLRFGVSIGLVLEDVGFFGLDSGFRGVLFAESLLAVTVSAVATEAALFFRFFFSFLASPPLPRDDSADLSLLRWDNFFSFLFGLISGASSTAS